MKSYGKKLSVLIAFASFGLSTMVAQAQERHQLKGHLFRGHEKVSAMGRLSSDAPMRLAIGLPLHNQTELESLLQQISDPKNPQYRHYLTTAEFTERFGPSPEEYQKVIHFAETHGLRVTGTHPNRMLVDVVGTAGDVENAFQLKMNHYSRPDGSVCFAPDSEPSVENGVPVLHVSGLDNYVLPKPLGHGVLAAKSAKPGHAGGAGIGGSYSADDLRDAFAPGVSLTGTGQSVGLFELDGFSMNNVLQYESLTGRPNVPVQTVPLNGFTGIITAGAELEVEGDIEMVIAMAPGVSKIMVYEASGGDSPADTVLNRMATDNICKQISCSWFFVMDATSIQIFQQMVAQGQAFFTASGDNGGYSNGVGLANQNQEQPNIVIVGGTELTTTGPSGAYVSETGWPGSGGGISSDVPIPAYQVGLNMSLNGGSTTMRNLPDIAMPSTDLFGFTSDGNNIGSGIQLSLFGTSFATPLWAGFMALANQQAVANGKPIIGFPNPAFYTIGQGPNYHADFHDIADGSNNNLFTAVSGYDLVTGWGSPTGQNLINDLAGVSSGPTVTPTKTFTPGSPTATPTGTTVPGRINILSVNPACAPAGASVTVVWSWSSNNTNGNVNYVIGFGPNGTPNCASDVWVSPYACNQAGTGVINTTSAGVNVSGTVTSVVRVPAGASLRDVLVGFTYNCGTVQFTALNNNCAGMPDFWAAASFNQCGTNTPTFTRTFTPTPTKTFTPTPTPSGQVNCAGVPTWVGDNRLYNVNQLVIYSPNHSEYKALVANFGFNGAPPNIPTVWQFVGVCSGSSAAVPLAHAGEVEPEGSVTPEISMRGTGDGLIQSVKAEPNITHGGTPVKVEVVLAKPAKVNLNIFTSTSELVYQTSLEGIAGSNNLTWDLKNGVKSGVADGLYVYVVRADDGERSVTQTGKIAVFH